MTERGRVAHVKNEVAVTIKLSGPLWNFIGETLAYDPAKHEWASVEDTIVAVLQDVYESGQETPEG